MIQYVVAVAHTVFVLLTAKIMLVSRALSRPQLWLVDRREVRAVRLTVLNVVLRGTLALGRWLD